MRTNKELLKVLLKHIDKLETGLCHLSYHLSARGIIRFDEYHKIIRYLKKNKPAIALTQSYWFCAYDKEPRIEWLKQQIEKL